MEILRHGARASLRQSLRSPALRYRFEIAPLRIQTQPTFRTRPNLTVQSRSLHVNIKRPVSRKIPNSPPRRTRRWASDDAALDKPDSQLSLSQKLKKLSREYGWAAFYVYMALSALDFPFCFLAVKWLGTDTVGHWEHVVVSTVKEWLQWPLGGDLKAQVGEAVDKVAELSGAEDGKRVLDDASGTRAIEDHGYKEAEEANSGSNATIWTQLALAYAIHKSFIFIRIPLTAAILPKIVKTLRRWGWNIGRPTRKAIKSSKGTSNTGINTKGSSVKSDD